MTNLLFSSAALSSAAGNYQTDFPLAGATYTGYSRHGILVCDSSPSPSLRSPPFPALPPAPPPLTPPRLRSLSLLCLSTKLPVSESTLTLNTHRVSAAQYAVTALRRAHRLYRLVDRANNAIATRVEVCIMYICTVT